MKEQLLQFLSDRQLSTRYEVSRSTIWRWTQEGHLPSPVKLSPGCSRWKLSDLEAWEAERGAA